MTTQQPTSVRRGLTYVTIAAIAWGTGGVVAAILYRTSGLGPFAVSFWRTVGGVALLALVHRLRPGPAPVAGGRRWLPLVTGAGLATYQTAYYAAVHHSGVAFATVVTLGAGPILIAVGSWLAIGERLGLAGTVAVGLAPIGLLLIGGGGSGDLVGVGLSLLSATGYAVVTVLHRALRGVEPVRTTLTGFAVAAVLLAPLAVLEGAIPAGGFTWPTVGLLAYLGAVTTALAYSLFFASLGSVRATTVSVVALAEPLTATAIAVTLLGEPLTVPMLAGSALLVTAVFLLTRPEPAPQHPPIMNLGS